MVRHSTSLKKHPRPRGRRADIACTRCRRLKKKVWPFFTLCNYHVPDINHSALEDPPSATAALKRTKTVVLYLSPLNGLHNSMPRRRAWVYPPLYELIAVLVYFYHSSYCICSYRRLACLYNSSQISPVAGALRTLMTLFKALPMRRRSVSFPALNIRPPWMPIAK